MCEFPGFGSGLRHYVRVNNPQELIRTAVQGAQHICDSGGEFCSSLTNPEKSHYVQRKKKMLSGIQEDPQKDLPLGCRTQSLDFFP